MGTGTSRKMRALMKPGWVTTTVLLPAEIYVDVSVIPINSVGSFKFSGGDFRGLYVFVSGS